MGWSPPLSGFAFPFTCLACVAECRPTPLPSACCGSKAGRSSFSIDGSLRDCPPILSCSPREALVAELPYTRSGVIGPRSCISSAIVAGTPVPPTSGALYIFLWKMPTEVSHNIHLLLLVSVTLFVERVKLEFDLQFTSASLKLHHVSTKNMSAT